jgi:hypothetical protein
MAYIRKTYGPRSQPHSLFTDFRRLEQLTMDKDSNFVSYHLEDLHSDSNFFLAQMERLLERLKKEDYSDYTDAAKAKRLAEPILKARKAILDNLKKHIDAARENLLKHREAILRVAEPPEERDAIKRVERKQDFREIRDLIRAEDPKTKLDYIRTNVARNPDWMYALSSSPDEIVPDDVLHQLKRDFAFAKDPSLKVEEDDLSVLYFATRKRAGEVNSSSILMLNKAKLGIDDPVPPPLHFQTFSPDTPYEKYIMEKRLRSWESTERAKDRKAKWEEEHKHSINEDFTPGEAKRELQEQRKEAELKQKNPVQKKKADAA